MSVPLVIDIGAHSIRLGHAGGVLPEVVYPTVVGLPRVPGNLSLREIGVFPLSEQEKLDHTKIVYPFVPNLDHTELNEEALTTMLVGLQADAHELGSSSPHLQQGCSVLLAEPTYPVEKFRERVTEILFETCSIGSFLPQRCATLTVFANARESAVVMDLGHHGTTCCVVHNGLINQQSVTRHPIGGSMLSRVAGAYLRQKGITVPTLFQIREGPGVLHPFVEEDYSEWNTDAFVAKMLFDVDFTFDDSVLPDGTALSHCFRDIDLANLVVEPASQNLKLPFISELVGIEQPLAECLLNAISSEGVCANPDIVNSILPCGGLATSASILAALEESIELQQAKRVKNNDLDPFGGLPSLPMWSAGNKRKSALGPSAWGWRLLCSRRPQERRFSAWIGGSILASLGVYASVAINKDAYEEYGSSIVTRTMLS
eukprot:Gregarina_sp_Poly_1__409@NODE_10_length_23460_cov_121_463087_g8_i1_p4_GENE_NODE_10_length_23460_cov_121_463087_g8_i1NODE_10_length_23460_cov_121_463087_g8_i1_p4_ORF_typecomplete_len430_score47_98Actin/PF00022_19/2_9e39_NODE_10_length_23460_cov_121_463087_g8_i11700318292